MNQLNCINYQNKKLTIEEIRNRVSMSKEEFANRIGISLATYNKKISNQSKWKLNELETIGKLFDLPIEQINY